MLPYREVWKTAKEPLSKRDPKIDRLRKMFDIDKRKSMAFLAAVMMVTSGAALGVGTFSYFSDTGQVNQNLFTAGTIDMKLSPNSDGAWSQSLSGTWGADNFAPGDTTQNKIWIKNTGSLGGSFMLADFVEGDNYDPELAQNIKVWIADGNESDVDNPNWQSWPSLDLGTLDEFIHWDATGASGDWDFILFADNGWTDKGEEDLSPNDTYSGTLLPTGDKMFFGMKFMFNDTMKDQSGLQGKTANFRLDLKVIHTDTPVTRGWTSTIPDIATSD